jgi:hypothetical protein
VPWAANLSTADGRHLLSFKTRCPPSTVSIPRTMDDVGPLDADYFSAADESDNPRGQVGARDGRYWCRSFSRHEWNSVLRRPI